MERKASFSNACSASRWRIKTTTARRHCLYNPVHINIMTMLIREKKKSIPYWSFGCLQKNTWTFVDVSLFWRVGHLIQKHLGRSCCSNHMTACPTPLWNGCGIQKVSILVTLGIGCWEAVITKLTVFCLLNLLFVSVYFLPIFFFFFPSQWI